MSGEETMSDWDGLDPSQSAAPGSGAFEGEHEVARAYGDAQRAADEAMSEDGPDAADGAEVAEAAGPPDGEESPVLPDVEKLTAERDEYLDALRRLQAEFDNYRKRTVRQQTELLDRAAEGLLERLLPVLDAVDLALAHVGEPDSADEQAKLSSAFVQIGTLLRDILAKEGLERIDEAGVPFDPTVHDAVAHLLADALETPDAGASPDDEPGGAVVAEVLRAGYRLKGRVVRPAMVNVRG
ncbi:MAG TPA: nucleotide exchange factor GrpE [Acidimicrobiales bacterium]|nr:nucleotide exchange factor GrpE [Acidimicrobiales bacterium]